MSSMMGMERVSVLIREVILEDLHLDRGGMLRRICCSRE